MLGFANLLLVSLRGRSWTWFATSSTAKWFLLVVFLCIQRRNKISVGRSVLRLKEDGSDGAETRLRL